jgi:hypothetical protein
MTEIIQVDIKDLKFEFNPIPTKISFPYGWSFMQKLSGSLGKAAKELNASNLNDKDLIGACTSLIPVLGEAVNNLINSFSHEEILKIIGDHVPFIKTIEEKGKTPLNIDYSFSNRPELILILFVKIVEVYYKSFFTELLTLPGIKEKVDLIKEKISSQKEDMVQPEEEKTLQ